MKSQPYGLTPIRGPIQKILKPVLNKKKDYFLLINNLHKNWPNIVGERFYQLSIAKKIKFDKKNSATLYITSHSPAVAYYLEANSSQIIEKIASLYGYKIIKEIRIIQELKNINHPTPIAENKISQESEDLINNSISNIKDEGLKSILQQLGKSILK